MRQYIATNGEDGHMWRGMPSLLLTTTGRKSGERLQLPLIYGRDGDRYLLVASKGGTPDHPAWYKNLVANPGVELQVGAERFAATARTATDAEKPALWETMANIWPGYNEYQARTDRQIPVVILEKA
jgi:deazaflavin-dependent oxidoreductase (nitroreductase family)